MKQLVYHIMGFPGGASGKEPACQCRRETRVRSLGWEDSLEEVMATHSNILPWRIPCTEEPGRLQSTGSHRIRYNWSDLARMHTCHKVISTQEFFLKMAERELGVPVVGVAILNREFKEDLIEKMPCEQRLKEVFKRSNHALSGEVDCKAEGTAAQPLRRKHAWDSWIMLDLTGHCMIFSFYLGYNSELFESSELEWHNLTYFKGITVATILERYEAQKLAYLTYFKKYF